MRWNVSTGPEKIAYFRPFSNKTSRAGRKKWRATVGDVTCLLLCSVWLIE
jgi:hypothetical protein